jgi:hypothetical protein
MEEQKHTFANIEVVTESGVPINIFSKPLFRKFTSKPKSNKITIFNYFIKISKEELTQPVLKKNELVQLLYGFTVNSSITSSTLTLPPIIFNPEINKDQYNNESKGEYPLLCSKKIINEIKKLKFHSEHVIIILHKYYLEIHDFLQKKAIIYYLEDQDKIFEATWIENGFRRLYSLFLPSCDAVILHSSGLIDKGNGILFLAPDEGGKTTAQSLSNSTSLLSDDRNIVRKIDGKFKVFGTPWGSIVNPDAYGDLKILILLKKSSHFRITPIKNSDLLEFIWNEHKMLWHQFQKKKIFNLITDICFQIPTYQLFFSKDYIDWDAIDRAMKK